MWLKLHLASSAKTVTRNATEPSEISTFTSTWTGVMFMWKFPVNTWVSVNVN